MKRVFTRILATALMMLLLSGCTSLNAPAAPAAPAATPAPSPTAEPKAEQVVDPITIKVAFGSSQALTDEAHKIMCDEIESLSKGAIKVERYLQGQLYTADADGSIALSEGTVDMIIMGDLMVSAAAPGIAGFAQIPFAFDSKEHCHRFWLAISDKVNEKMLEKYGCRILFDSLELRGPRIVVGNKPIKSADDFKGLKMRLPAIAASVAAFESLGCNPITSSWAEVYGVLQNGTAHACESPLSTFDSISVYEVAKYASLTNHTYSFRAAHVNEKWWSKLSPKHQEIIQAGIKKGFDYFNTQEENGDSEIVKKWKDKGMTIVQNNEIDLESIKNTATPTILEKYKNEWDMTVWDEVQKTK